MLAESYIKRESRSLITLIIDHDATLTSKSGPSSSAIHFDLNKLLEGKLRKDKFSSLLFRLSLLQKLTQQ